MAGDQQAHADLVTMTDLLGLGQQLTNQTKDIDTGFKEKVEALIAKRQQAKLAKNYQLADHSARPG